MISETTSLLTTLLGTIFPSWLNCDPIRVLIELFFVAFAISFVFKFFRR